MSQENTSSSGSEGSSSENSGSESSGFIPTDEQPVFFTLSAIEAIKNAVKEEGEAGDGLRVSVVGGGCSGYQYNLDFDKEARMGDITLELDGVNVYIDSISAGYLRGTTVDHVAGLHGTGFKFNNPTAKRSCGCGNSFS